MWKNLIQVLALIISNNKALVMTGFVLGMICGATLLMIAPHLWFVPWIVVIFELAILIKMFKQDDLL